MINDNFVVVNNERCQWVLLDEVEQYLLSKFLKHGGGVHDPKVPLIGVCGKSSGRVMTALSSCRSDVGQRLSRANQEVCAVAKLKVGELLVAQILTEDFSRGALRYFFNHLEMSNLFVAHQVLAHECLDFF